MNNKKYFIVDNLKYKIVNDFDKTVYLDKISDLSVPSIKISYKIKYNDAEYTICYFNWVIFYKCFINNIKLDIEEEFLVQYHPAVLKTDSCILCGSMYNSYQIVWIDNNSEFIHIPYDKNIEIIYMCYKKMNKKCNKLLYRNHKIIKTRNNKWMIM